MGLGRGFLPSQEGEPTPPARLPQGVPVPVSLLRTLSLTRSDRAPGFAEWRRAPAGPDLAGWSTPWLASLPVPSQGPTQPLRLQVSASRCGGASWGSRGRGVCVESAGVLGEGGQTPGRTPIILLGSLEAPGQC